MKKILIPVLFIFLASILFTGCDVLEQISGISGDMGEPVEVKVNAKAKVYGDYVDKSGDISYYSAFEGMNVRFDISKGDKIFTLYRETGSDGFTGVAPVGFTLHQREEIKVKTSVSVTTFSGDFEVEDNSYHFYIEPKEKFLSYESARRFINHDEEYYDWGVILYLIREAH